MNPTTKEEAAKKEYGKGLFGSPGVPYKKDQCATEIVTWRKRKQCSRKPGHGPDGLYCKQHAKKVKE